MMNGDNDKSISKQNKLKGAFLVLSCNLPKYNKERFEQWGSTLCHVADQYPIYYLFGMSDTKPPVPSHPNVHYLQVNTGDLYEHISQKIYQGFKFLKYLNYDFIVKIDETITINNVNEFITILNNDLENNAYISLNGSSMGDGKHVTLSTYHFGKVSDKQYNTAPAIVLNIPYAGGPCYALRKDAINLLQKSIMYSTLYEDYAVGLCMYVNKIKLHNSRIIDRKLLIDKLNPSPIYLRFPPVENSAQFLTTLAKCWSFVPSEKKCNVIVNGGFGNQLFQIAMGINYAYVNNMRLELSMVTNNVRPYYWDSLLKHYSTFITPPTSGIMYNETAFSYKEIPVYDSDIIIKGYFQTSKYFQQIRNNITKLVCLPNITKVLAKYRPITANTVFVHARRGDYMNAIEYHGILGEDYYTAALNKIREIIPDPHFIVSSDESTFWKSSPIFKSSSVEYIDEDDINTFAIMTHIKHFVIANSSFSWWGAIMADASTVIAPRNWFGPTGPKDTSDIYEPSWFVL